MAYSHYNTTPFHLADMSHCTPLYFISAYCKYIPSRLRCSAYSLVARNHCKFTRRTTQEQRCIYPILISQYSR